jgi:hypothetical protein
MENNTQSEDMILNEVIFKIAHEELDKIGVPEEHSELFVALFAGGYTKALKDLAEGIDIFKEVEEKLAKK